MNHHSANGEFDAIIVGSGPGGATVARELSRRGKRVLILERGGNAPLQDSLFSIVSMLSGVSVGDRLVSGRALTTGGTTAVYLASTVRPPLELFQAMGIDLSAALEEAEKELPLATLPDSLLRPQSLTLRASAAALGHKLYTSRMLVDQSKCTSGYAHAAKWTARTYVQEAVENGAVLVNHARVLRVLVENGRAIGVEYELGKKKKSVEVRQAFGAKIVLAAGGASSPILLRRSGVRNVADRGFYCHPSLVVFGTTSEKGHDGFGGSWGLLLEDGIRLGDANFDRTFYRVAMLGQRKWLRAFSYSRSIGMGVMVRDGLGGGLREDDSYHKELTAEDRAKLAKGAEAARGILQHAGAKNLFTSSVSASHLGGAIRIKEHVDSKLETEFRGLYVCDGSVLPPEVNTPALTLICLGKYLVSCLA